MEDRTDLMFNHPEQMHELARQRIADLHEARRGRPAGRAGRLPRTRVYAGRMLIALGTRLAPSEPRPSSRVTNLAGR